MHSKKHYRPLSIVLVANTVPKLATGTVLHDNMDVISVLEGLLELCYIECATQSTQHRNLATHILDMSNLSLSSNALLCQLFADGLAGEHFACHLFRRKSNSTEAS